MTPPEVFQGSVAVAETARDKVPYTGFLAGLFVSDVRWHLFSSIRLPFISVQAQEFLERFKSTLLPLDPERIDSEGELPEAVMKDLAQLGAFGIKIPRCYGGKEFTQSEYQHVATLCGSVDSSLTVLLSAAQSIGVPEPLRLFGTEAQKTAYLPRLARGELSGFALTERHVGCDISKVETYAVRVREQGQTTGYRLSGEKFFITNSAKRDGEFLSSMLVVIARIVDRPEEVQDQAAPKRYGAFIVETHWPGCSVTRLRFEGVRAIYNGAPTFDRVFVPVDNRLGGEEDGLRIALATLTVGRLTLPAACLGGLKQCLSVMRWWGRKRVQWNKPIGEHNLIGEKLCRTAAYSLALEAVMAFCGAWANRKGDLRLESAAAKILGSEWYWEAVNDLFQVRGGRGFMTTESQHKSGEPAIAVMRMLRDARINLVWEGTSEILRIWMAREALSPYIDRGLAFLRGTWSDKLTMPLYYARMAMSSIWPFGGSPASSASVGQDYARWVRFIESSSRDLTRSTLMSTIRHRQRLHNKQLLLQHLVNDSLWIFPMAATIWYASQPDKRDKPGMQALVEYFCESVADRLHPSSSLAGRVQQRERDTQVYSLSKAIMDGQYAWLEEGILPCVKDEPALHETPRSSTTNASP
ncbi:acyl-CoA dehydrogenase [Nitrospira sp. KM1]|uniref:acyl-CoA dehydrogenase family protein n=1 Tax=Nitrospira sp. KM1 TaxID=1936990 RepID=UPI0013A74B18|nr:acyl-CoA dehydrogenase family protein [Nitrospira sp. KM1]BCA56958.1 acyl-CoA dehydrogenase [Nitrospira sp. KM1]